MFWAFGSPTCHANYNLVPPFIVQDERWSSELDPKLAGLLSDLEQGLGSVIRQSGPRSQGKTGLTEGDVLGTSTDRKANACARTMSELGLY